MEICFQIEYQLEQMLLTGKYVQEEQLKLFQLIVQYQYQM